MYISQETLPEVCHTIHQLLEKNIPVFYPKHPYFSRKTRVFFTKITRVFSASRKAFKKNHLQFNRLFALQVNDFTKIQKEREST